MDILRALQGIGPAASVPAAVSTHYAYIDASLIRSFQLGILAHAFPPSPIRSIAFATFSAGAPVGAAIGLTIGGLLTEFTKYASSRVHSSSRGSLTHPFSGKPGVRRSGA